MKKITLTVNGRTGFENARITVEREMIKTVSLGGSRPDPAWRSTDSHGHFHATNTQDDRNPFPTLKLTGEPCDIPGHAGDGCTIENYACRICGELVYPAFVFVAGAAHEVCEPGPLAWTLDAWCPHTLAVLAKPGELVSVRLDCNGFVYFGVGAWSVGSIFDDGVAVKIYGSGPLGRQEERS